MPKAHSDKKFHAWCVFTRFRLPIIESIARTKRESIYQFLMDSMGMYYDPGQQSLKWAICLKDGYTVKKIKIADIEREYVENKDI